MLYQAVRNSTLARYGTLSTSESIASSAVKTAIDVNAKALIVCSESGTTATQVAKFRPNCPIYVLTATERVARQCSGVLRGSSAVVINTMADMEPKINELIESFKKNGSCNAGDAVVVVTGTLQQSGSTNLMRVQYGMVSICFPWWNICLLLLSDFLVFFSLFFSLNPSGGSRWPDL